MSDIVFGEIDWNSADVKDGSGKTDFMKLESNSKSRVRVMGNPTQYYVHWVESASGKRKFNSPVGDAKLVKQLENAGFKRKPSWFIKVLDRSDNQFKLLEIGSQIFSGIKALVAESEWGPITGYDINIHRGSPGQQPLYRVTPCPKAALESSLKEAYMAFNDRVDINKFIQPAEPDTVREFLGWDAAPAKTAAASRISDDEDLFQFDQ